MCVGVVRFQFDGVRIGLERFAIAAQIAERGAHVEVRVEIGRIGLHGAFEAGDGRVGFAYLLLHNAEVVVRAGALWLQLQSGLEPRFCEIDAPQLQVGATQHVMERDDIGVVAQVRLTEADDLGELARAIQGGKRLQFPHQRHSPSARRLSTTREAA